MKENILMDKALEFAARIIKLQRYLLKEKREMTISNQIVRSGTSIGANISESVYGQSRLDFTSKLQISLKEASETEYWLRLLFKSELLTKEEFESLLKDCLEIKRLLISSINTAKKN